MNTKNGAKPNHSLNGAEPHQFPSLTLKADQLSVETTPKVKVPNRFQESTYKFDQPVLLQQSSLWSRAILWVLTGVTTTAIVWACIAKIEEAIPAQGKLEPLGTIKEMQAPVGGVVKAIYVSDGQRVKQGDLLLSLDSTAAKAQLASLKKIRTSLLQEKQFYQAQMSGSFSPADLNTTIVQLGLPRELASLTKSRVVLAAENQLYRAQLNGAPKGVRLSPEQQERLQSHQAELNTRVITAQLSVEQLIKKLNQTQSELATTKNKLVVNQEILQNIESLAKVGGISRIQYLKQQQEVQTNLGETDQLSQEQKRLKLAISEAEQKVQNTLALSRKDLLLQMANNDKDIAEIDSQLTKAIVENNKRIAEIDSQISQAKLTLQYQDLRAPVSGTVFDLQAHTPGFVANSSASILKIVPNETLTAKVFITNRDIGFIKEGMKVDVRIDSFPFSEFGDLKGQLVWIGADALPPDQIHSFYRFPAKIRLEQQSLLINGRKVPLQSGMSVSANIKVRQRNVMSIFTDVFTQKIENLKFVR
jgi:HlyD family secretion protein